MNYLRDRIAAAILRADCQPSTDTDPHLEMADAVIAALGLRPDTVGTLTRYVTEWEHQ